MLMVTITEYTTTATTTTARTIQDGIRFLTEQLISVVGYTDIVARSIAKKAIAKSIDHKCTVMVAYVNSTTISVTTEYKGILS